jgi:hypothetical protein
VRSRHKITCAVTTGYDSYWRPSVFSVRSVLTQGPTILGTSLHTVSVFRIPYPYFGVGSVFRIRVSVFRIRILGLVPYSVSVSVFRIRILGLVPYSVSVSVFRVRHAAGRCGDFAHIAQLRCWCAGGRCADDPGFLPADR